MSGNSRATYEIIEKIGSGGSGVVYLAWHTRLEKKVILKADKRRLVTRPEVMRRETDVLKTLNHPYIPQVYDYFYEDGTAYTVMEYIEGESLNLPLKRGERFPQAQVIKWAVQLLQALKYLHSPEHGDPPKGYLHGDIKPANLMRKPNGDICLIDFNIALAIGEDIAMGISTGYSSPEHYRMDYSVQDTQSASYRSGGMPIKPDARSDIYSVGATLYHLLTGKRPPVRVMDIEPLSKKEFNPQIVHIISKAMRLKPEERYQTAGEMLEDFLNLRKNDPRAKRLKWSTAFMGTLSAALLGLGVFSSITGLRRMQKTQEWLKMAEYSKDALSDGDARAALEYALEAFPADKNIFTPGPLPQAQLALTNALGVYRLSDGYRMDRAVSLPSEPLFMDISPEGRYLGCICLGTLVLVDTGSGEILLTLDAVDSALAEVHFLDESRFAYAGSDGITLYDLREGKELWHGDEATGICISGDSRVVAGVYKDRTECEVYDVQTGEVLHVIDFEGKHQSVAVNDRGVNPFDNLFELNEDGSRLGISFEDSVLKIYDFNNEEKNIEIYDDSIRYTHFEGGFCRELFAFAAIGGDDAEVVVIDMEEPAILFGKADFGKYGAQVDGGNILISRDSRILRYDPELMDMTGYLTADSNILAFANYGDETILSTKEDIRFISRGAVSASSLPSGASMDLICMAGRIAALGSFDSPTLRLLTYQENPETVFARYDAGDLHEEARISADGSTCMLFSPRQFTIYDREGKMLEEITLPDADSIYDQQYIRDERGSRLEVTYYDGTVSEYDAIDGSLTGSRTQEAPDSTLFETLSTEHYRISSPLHGTPQVHSIQTGEVLYTLDEDAYLTYAVETGGRLILQYITTDFEKYGCMLDQDGNLIAVFPNLCDIYEEKLYFDYPDGTIRETGIYSLEELLALAENDRK